MRDEPLFERDFDDGPVLAPEVAASAASRSPFESGRIIGDVARMRRTALDQVLGRHGISFTQWWALTRIAADDGGLSQSALARQLEIGKVALGYLLGRMAKAGLLTRQADQGDRRSKRIVLTERGREVLDRIDRVANAVTRRIMAGITTEEEHRLIEILEKVKHNTKALVLRDV